MIKYLVILVSFTLSSLSAQNVNTFFNDTDAFLKTYVSGSKVDYASIKSNPAKLNALVEQISKANLSKENANTKKAFYINAYNITMISAIVKKYPVKAPTDIPGVFDKTKYTIAGASLTLNDVENKMLRAVYKDARIHFVLVCGANGCPPIINAAYMPSTLEVQLEKQTKLAINNANFIKIDRKAKKVQVSQIFEWYKEDFGSNNNSLISFLNKYLSSKIESNYKVSYYTYDWTLNKK